MGRVFMYVVDRDFGFAPNPFHGCCTLATCKPRIRRTAETGDWIIGMGGGRLKATGRCIFAMLVTKKTTFDEYWWNPAYLDKKPVRNGSRKMMVGDNIYHHDLITNQWCQADSHHSNADGTINFDNLRRDTETDRVLVSKHFFYFGKQAPMVPVKILDEIGFENGIGHRTFDLAACADLISWIRIVHGGALNVITGDPFDFSESHGRYTGRGSKILH